MHTNVKQVQLDSLDGDLRCDCGKLLARILHTVLELRCPRCKRSVLVVDGRRYQPADGGPCTCGDDQPQASLPAHAHD